MREDALARLQRRPGIIFAVRATILPVASGRRGNDSTSDSPLAGI